MRYTHRSFILLVAYIVCACALVSCGAGGTSETTTTAPPVLEAFSGNIANTPSDAIPVGAPLGVAADDAGNVYVADHNYIISKITPTGVTTPIYDARRVFAYLPSTTGDIASDRTGNVYIANISNDDLVKISRDGKVNVLFGGSYNSPTGSVRPIAYFHANGITTDKGGNVYMITTNNAILKFTPDEILTTLNCTNETGSAPRCNLFHGLAIDSVDNFYTLDTSNNTIYKISPAGLVTMLAGSPGLSGSTDGMGSAARFNLPKSIASDNADNIYVADSGNNTIRKITPAGMVTTLAGSAGIMGRADGTGAAARFNTPYSVTTDNAGNIYVDDIGNTSIRKITSAGVVTTFPANFSIDGIGTTARFRAPEGIATDSAGNAYVVDSYNATIRKITPAGGVTTLAGIGGLYGSTDGMGTAATFQRPLHVATDRADNIYVTDDTAKIRKITPTGVVTTFAGTPGESGSRDGTGSAASFSSPSGLATDSADNIYVADTGNATIRKITPAGVVTTVAGTVGAHDTTDGTGTAAHFSYPHSIATDNARNVYVAGDDATVRKITPNGIVSTMTGIPGVYHFTEGSLPGGLLSIKGMAIYGTSLYITTGRGVAVVRNLPNK